MSKSVTGKAVDLFLLKRVLKYVKPYNRTFFLTCFTTILLAVLAPLRPWLIKYTFDNFILLSNASGLLTMTLIMTALLFVEAIVQYNNTFMANWLGQTVIKDLRVDVYKHLLSFKLKYFDRTPIGTLVTRSISDIETIADIFSEGLLVIIGDLLKIFVIVGVMFFLNIKLTLISLSVLPVLIFSAWVFKNAIKSAFQDVRTQVANLNAFVQEHITGMSIVQIFNREETEMDKFKHINMRHRDANIRSVWHYSVFLPVVEILSAVSIGLLIWWGANSIIRQVEGVTLGTLTAFILFLHMLFRPIRELADKFNVLQMGMVSSERVFKVMDTHAYIQDTGTNSMDKVQGNIEFNNVWFAYNEEDYVLKGVSFTAKKGETLALIGSTGSGKTSIINVLGRFYEYQKGQILVDNQELKDYKISSIRDNIAVVLQDVFLFSGSVLNNITLNNPDITRDEVIEAAKIVGAHDFIIKLPGGYDFNVMERGGMLSVGQRQLISFIRAYVYNPKILILDEATSSVDTGSEQLIQYAIDKITENRTSIIIAHRLATVQKADKIIVLSQGQIVESGSHQELLKIDGQYRKLFELQFKGTYND
ncbi:MAG: ABC transporter ATP-binding protein [Bacteroidetes bacterium]|nr:ABC transporter ATP-binding protein [Bacteroidota bacterium]HET6244106.1 ABC transporter ATP-binding protein [Bacteroidia bacterium]